MEVLYVMIPISALIALGFLYVFIKLVKSGQYDDVYTPSVRMLFDDDKIKNKENIKYKSKN